MKTVKTLIASALMAMTCAANATYTITVAQSGPDVVMTGAGSLNTTGLTFNTLQIPVNGFGQHGGISNVQINVGNGTVDRRATNAVAPALSNLAAFRPATGSTGPAVFIDSADLYLSGPYTSGAPIANSSTYANTTLQQLALVPQTVTLPSGDTIVIRLAPAPVPVSPASATSIPTLSEYGLMALASLMAMVGFAYVRRRQS